MPPQTPYPPKESWWPTIGAIVLLIIILLLAAYAYLSYAHNVELAGENSDLHNQMQTLNADKGALAVQVADLTKQVAKSQCDGVWNNDACEPYPVTITTKVASGTSPFVANFTIRAKTANYTIDFGDGTSSPLSTGVACTLRADGFCLLTVQHRYRNADQTEKQLDVKVMKDKATVATTPIAVRGK